jgi:hypothetical protein
MLFHDTVLAASHELHSSPTYGGRGTVDHTRRVFLEQVT